MSREPGRRKSFIKPLAVACVAALLAGMLAAALIYFRVGAKSAALLSLRGLLGADSLGFAVDATVAAGEQEYDLSAEVRVGSVDGTEMTAITWKGLSLYCTDNIVFLEDGTAYLLAGDLTNSESLAGEEGEGEFSDEGAFIVPDDALLALVMAYYADTEIEQRKTEESTVYSISLDSDSCMELLALLLPSAAESVSGAGATTIDLYVAGGDAQSIVIFSSAAPAGDDNTSELQFRIRIDIMDGESSVLTVPEAVLAAMESGDTGDLPVLTQDLLELFAAWNAWKEQDDFGAAITIDADLGPILLSPEAVWIHTKEDGAVVDRITIGGVTFVYSEGEGEPEEELSREEETAANMMILPELAYEMFLRGGISFTEEGESMTCSVSLTEQQMESIVTALIPDAAQLEIRYGEGLFEVVVKDGEFTSLSLKCSGEITILLAEVPISLRAQMQLMDPGTKD